jgi:sensor c-di-GMP phosphodiesterase-like protein
VAEGVKTEQQREYPQQHGCDQVQDYVWGKPQPSDAFVGRSIEGERRSQRSTVKALGYLGATFYNCKHL